MHFGYILATRWLYSCYILATFWLLFATFWLHFGYILAIFWLHWLLLTERTTALWAVYGHFFIWSVSLITLLNRKNQLIIASLPQIRSEAGSCTGILRHRNHHMISCTPLSNRSTIYLLCCSPVPHWRAHQWVDRRGWFLVQQVVTPFWTKDMLLIHIFGLAKCLKTAYFCSGRSSVETSVVEDVLDRVS